MAGDSHFRLAWVHARQLVPAFVQMVMVMASRLPPGPVGIVGTRSGIPRQALRLPGRLALGTFCGIFIFSQAHCSLTMGAHRQVSDVWLDSCLDC